MKLLSRTRYAWLTFVLFGAAGLSFADARISVQALDAGGYRLRLSSPQPITAEEARRRVLPMGEQLCGGVAPTLGTSELKTAGTGVAFVQELRCPERGTQNNSREEPASTLTSEQRQRIELQAKQLTAAYLEHLAGENYAAAYESLSEPLKAQRSFQRWQGGLAAWRRAPGVPQSRDLLRTSVYVDPPNTRPGIYAIVKFEESFEQLPLVCGFLVWAFGDDENARIVREVQAHLDTNAYAKTKPEQLNIFRRARGCEPI